MLTYALSLQYSGAGNTRSTLSSCLAIFQNARSATALKEASPLVYTMPAPPEEIRAEGSAVGRPLHDRHSIHPWKRMQEPQTAPEDPESGEERPLREFHLSANPSNFDHQGYIESHFTFRGRMRGRRSRSSEAPQVLGLRHIWDSNLQNTKSTT